MRCDVISVAPCYLCQMGAPTGMPAQDDTLLYLTENRSFWLSTPPTLHNHGNHILSLGQLCGWLGEKAEEMGVEIYPSFAASEVVRARWPHLYLLVSIPPLLFVRRVMRPAAMYRCTDLHRKRLGQGDCDWRRGCRERWRAKGWVFRAWNGIARATSCFCRGLPWLMLAGNY